MALKCHGCPDLIIFFIRNKQMSLILRTWQTALCLRSENNLYQAPYSLRAFLKLVNKANNLNNSECQTMVTLVLAWSLQADTPVVEEQVVACKVSLLSLWGPSNGDIGPSLVIASWHTCGGGTGGSLQDITSANYKK